MKRTTQIGLCAAVAAVLLIGLAIPASADRGDHHRYRAPQHSYGPSGQHYQHRWTPHHYGYPHGQWLPPGQAMHRGQWSPPGQRRHVERGWDYRYDPRYGGPCDRDGRYGDRRHERRGGDDWGVVIRGGRGGTTVGGYYHGRGW